MEGAAPHQSTIRRRHDETFVLGSTGIAEVVSCLYQDTVQVRLVKWLVLRMYPKRQMAVVVNRSKTTANSASHECRTVDVGRK